MKKFTQSHEWIDSNGRVGITAHALGQLGDIVFVELPEENASLRAGETVAVVESHKAASDIYTPLDGTVSELNQSAVDAPEDISTDEDLWLFTLVMTNPESLDNLMDEATYHRQLESDA